MHRKSFPTRRTIARLTFQVTSFCIIITLALLNSILVKAFLSGSTYLPLVYKDPTNGRTATPPTIPTTTVTPTPDPTIDWKVKCIDCPKKFFNSSLSDRHLAVDSNGLPGVVYGGDHLFFAQNNGVEWQVMMADSARGVGSSASLVFDESGNPHISYYDSVNKRIKYTYWDGSLWEKRTINSGNTFGWLPLALDNQGLANIAYWNPTDNSLKFAAWTGTGWEIQKVGTESLVSDLSLALDAGGNPHLSYVTNDYNVKHAWREGENWSIELVATSSYPSGLSMAAAGTKVVLSFGYGSQIAVAEKESGAWTIEHLDVVAGVNSLRVDPVGDLHLSYVETDLAEVRYAHRTNGEWRFETVAHYSGYNPLSISLALDPPGHPQISYFDSSYGGLKWARKMGNSWEVQEIDEGAQGAGGYPSISIDSSGNPHVSYGGYLRTEENLAKYARWNGSAWEIENLNAPDQGSIIESQLQLDSLDRPHLIILPYNSEYLGDLLYQYWDGSDWVTETIATGVTAYRPPSFSFAMDSLGNAHVSFEQGGILKYAQRAAGEWELKTIDGKVSNGYESAIAVDQAGRPQITYYRQGSGLLNHAQWMEDHWEIEIIQYVYTDNPQLSLVLDEQGHPHLVFSMQGTYLSYARKTGDEWLIDHIAMYYEGDEPPLFALYGKSSLGLDPSGQPLIAYTFFSPEGSELRVGQWTGKAWNFYTVLNGGNTGLSPAIAINSQGKIFVSFHDGPTGDLFMAEGN